MSFWLRPRVRGPRRGIFIPQAAAAANVTADAGARAEAAAALVADARQPVAAGAVSQRDD
jgi:hypothetical protein